MPKVEAPSGLNNLVDYVLNKPDLGGTHKADFLLSETVIIAQSPAIKPPAIVVLRLPNEQAGDALRKSAKTVSAGLLKEISRDSAASDTLARSRKKHTQSRGGGRSRRCSRCNGKHSSFGEQCRTGIPGSNPQSSRLSR